MTGHTDDSGVPLHDPGSGSAYLNASTVPWEPTEHDKFWIKRLYEDEARAERTWLMRMDPGARTESHAHEEFEQFLVLEGSLYDDEKTMKAGDYVCRAPGAMHTAATDEGAIVLLIYTRHAPL